MIKYTKADVDYKLADLTQSKIRLVDNDDPTPENIWILFSPDDKFAILQNHAVTFYPFPSWGALLPITTKGYIDVTELKSEEPSVIPLHPEAWDEYVKQGIIDTEGNRLEGSENK